MSDAATASDAPAATSAAPAVDASAAPASAAPAPAAPAPAPAAASAPAAPAAPNLLSDDAPKDDTTDTAKAGDGKDGDQKAAGAPEEYGEFETAEGVKALPSETLTEFKTMAKEAGLTQEAAQKFVNLAAKMQAGSVDALRTTVDNVATEWATASKADTEIGGAKFQENLGVAKQALETFGTPELKQFLNESRMGNHPELLRLLVRAGKAISQDGFIPGRQSSAAPKDTADVLYGSPKS